MPGYDSWKTRAPDLDGPEEPSLEQQRADYEDEMQQIENVGNNAAVPDGDVRWAVNVLLEKIAAKFEAWDTFDLFRSEAAATVRSFKHDLSQTVGSDAAISDNSSHTLNEPQGARK